MSDPLLDLEAFIDERWAVVQPRCFSNATEGWRLTPYGSVPPFAEAITSSEAAFFLASVTTSGSDAPLLIVHDNNKLESNRYPAVAKGNARAYVFFEKSGARMGGLRLETIVHWSAMARLRREFGWPREHLLCESPSVIEDGHEVLHQDALDILVLEEPCAAPAPTMSITGARSRVGIEAKATSKMLDKLLAGMRACEMFGRPHDETDHKKCLAIAVLRPSLFLGVAAGERWRLFTVFERNGRAVLGKELSGLDGLFFMSVTERP